MQLFLQILYLFESYKRRSWYERKYRETYMYHLLISSNTEEKMLAFQVLGNMDGKKSNTGAVHDLCVSNKKQMLIQRSQHR